MSTHARKVVLEKLLEPRELAARLNVSREAVYDKVKRGELPFVRIGRLIRFDPVKIEEWLERQTYIPGEH